MPEIEHINYQIPAQMHSKKGEPMYYIHKYWARKPHNVVSEYIKHYSKEGDIILDPFAGSGVTALEAVKANRKGIAIDINPIASFITYCTAIDCDLELLKQSFNAIKQSVEKRIKEFYTIKCKKCKKDVVASHFVWRQNKKTKEEELLDIYYFCNDCSKQIMAKKPDLEDLKKIQRINKTKILADYPKIKFKYPTGKRFIQLRHDMIQEPTIETLYTKRNLHSCALIFEGINELPENNKKEKNVKDILKLTFTAFIAKASKMNIINVGGYSSKGRGWTLHFFWNPTEYIEQNPLNDFESQFEITFEAKKQTNQIGYKIAKDFQDLITTDKNLLILTHSVLSLIDEDTPRNSVLQKDSIDYIFTDPPYGSSIQYYELSFLWNSWLGFTENNEEEIIINKNQGKDFYQYDKLLLRAFKQTHSALKSGKYLTVTFHNEKIQIRNSLIRSVTFSGFDLQKILYQTPSKIPAKASLHPYGTPVGDYYIRFYKSPNKKERTEEQMDKDVQERIVVDAITTVLAERGEPTSYAWLLNTIDTKLIERGYNLLSSPEELKKIIEKHLGKEFVLVEIQEGLNKVKKWWFKDPATVPHLKTTPLSERVEKAIIAVLKRKIILEFDDVQREIFMQFPNALTPETQSIKQILSEYADKRPDGKWKIKQETRDENAHQAKINSLVKLGKAFGFDIYAAHVAEEIEKDVIKQPELQISEIQLKKVMEIDCLWIKHNQIKYSFEIENSTQITEAISRGSNIPYKTERIILIPDSKEKLLKSKFQNVMLKERVEQDNWRVIPYSKFEDFEKSRSKTIESFNKLAIKPRAEPRKQTQLGGFT